MDMTRGMGGAAGGASDRGNALNDLFARQKVSQRYGTDHPSLTARPKGGDEDLPLREPLHERRAKFDAAAARRAARDGAGGFGGDEDDGAEEYDLSGGAKGGKRRAGGEEDDFYATAKVGLFTRVWFEAGVGGAAPGFRVAPASAACRLAPTHRLHPLLPLLRVLQAGAAARKKARSDAHRAPELKPPAPDPKADGARGITDEIQRNRGLTPHRRRDQKNPRKKNRMKFEKAMVRVKGAVQQVRQPEATAYGGEATGIKTKVAKSRRL